MEEIKHIMQEHFYSPTEAVAITKGKGVYVWADNGKRYLDGAAATFNLSLGYSNEEIIEAAIEQMHKIIHQTSTYMSEPIVRLIDELAKITPPHLNKIHVKISGGSTANEGAIKMAQFKNKKSGVISLFRSHVGQTIYTTNLSGLGFRREPFNNLSNAGIVHVPPAYCYRCFYEKHPNTCNVLCARRVEEFIKYACNGNVSAMILEPILGNGDNIVPPREYMVKLRELADKYDFALIFDEIQTGIGRTGEMFAANYFNVEPDILTISKGLGGTGFQISAIAVNDKYAGMDAHFHSFTYGANSMAAAAACKTIEIIQRDNILDNVKVVGNYILARMGEIMRKHKIIGDVRGVGLMIGFELVDEDGAEASEMTQRLQSLLFENGLILRSSRYGQGNVLKIRPALNISMTEAKELCDIIEYSVECL